MKTKIIKGSKFNFVINRMLSYASVFFKNKEIEKFKLFLHGDFVIKNRYGKFYGNFNDDSLDIYSPYFECTLQHWFNYDNLREIFLDIGANRGRYTIQAINYLGYKKVIAFEPLTYNYKILLKNIELNEISNKVNVYKYALSDKNKTEKIFFNKLYTGQASLNSGQYKNYEIVKVKKIDDVIKEYEIIKKISFIKIDVEGHELNVLKGGNKFFNRLKKGTCLMIEIWKSSPHKQEIISVLNKFGFNLKENIGDN